MQEKKQNISPIKQRILQFAGTLGISKRDFYTKIGVSRGTLESKTGITEDVMAKFIATFPDISYEWLLSGKGSMLKDENRSGTSSTCFYSKLGTIGESKSMSKSISTSSSYTSTDRFFNEPEAIPFAEAARNGLHPIPLVTQRAAAGFGNGDFTIEESDVKEYYVIPKFKYCHVDFMIEVSGLSMYPHFNPGDVIACTILRNSQFLQWNKCHVIATREQGILVKRLMPGDDKEHLRAISDNKEYPPFDIPVGEITGIAVVVGHVGLE